MSVARCSTRTVKTLGLRSQDPKFCVRLTRRHNNPLEKPRKVVGMRLALDQSAFKLFFRLAAKHVEHLGGMATHALALGMGLVARQPCSHEKRAVFLGGCHCV